MAVWLCSSQWNMRENRLHPDVPCAFLHVFICLLDGWNGDASWGNSGSYVLKVVEHLSPWNSACILLAIEATRHPAVSGGRNTFLLCLNHYPLQVCYRHLAFAIWLQMSFTCHYTLTSRTGIPHLLWKKRSPRMATPKTVLTACLCPPRRPLSETRCGCLRRSPGLSLK